MAKNGSILLAIDTHNNHATITALSKPSEPANRLILLGASNLTMSLRLAIQQMQYHCGAPSEVLAAVGHGRSYGQNSRVLLRELPAIINSGLWAQLTEREMRPTYAILTDIGNDILYGYSPAQILQWVAWCIERLQLHSAQIVLSNLPILTIESLSEWRYQLFRQVFYSSCQLSKAEVVHRARAVHQGLIGLTANRQCVLCEQNPNWMGADGIHYAYSKRSQPYHYFCAQFREITLSPENTAPRLSYFRTWSEHPQFAYQKIWGKERICPQPSGQLPDGTTVSLF